MKLGEFILSVFSQSAQLSSEDVQLTVEKGNEFHEKSDFLKRFWFLPLLFAILAPVLARWVKHFIDSYLSPPSDELAELQSQVSDLLTKIESVKHARAYTNEQ